MYVINEGQGHVLTLAQGHLNIKIKIMVFSEITGFGNYCSLRPETLQMQTTYGVNKGVRVFKVKVISL